MTEDWGLLSYSNTNSNCIVAITYSDCCRTVRSCTKDAMNNKTRQSGQCNSRRKQLRRCFRILKKRESIVPSISLAAPAGRGVSGPASSQGPKGTKGNSKNIVPESQHPSGRQAAATKPAVEASRQRSKTMKDFKNAELGMKKALEAGENVLQNVALKVHSGDQDQCSGMMGACDEVMVLENNLVH